MNTMLDWRNGKRSWLKPNPLKVRVLYRVPCGRLIIGKISTLLMCGFTAYKFDSCVFRHMILLNYWGSDPAGWGHCFESSWPKGFRVRVSTLPPYIAPSPSGKATACKAVTHQFDSDRGFQICWMWCIGSTLPCEGIRASSNLVVHPKYRCKMIR